jgi:hypothetical protein
MSRRSEAKALPEPFRYQQHDKFRRPIDESRCRAAVSDGRDPVSYQCANKPLLGSEWCRTHNPEDIAKRERARHERCMAKVNSRRRAANSAALIDVLGSEAVDVIDCLRGEATLEEFVRRIVHEDLAQCRSISKKSGERCIRPLDHGGAHGTSEASWAP